ncbi:hypothetical protein NECAME_14825 [Necator americanus]|uniref:Uncharacterized protein n=1 Tax=Necator americanus TaxID=51031 RepID=W2SNS8_NECAM|nr:hypothetical protein NECAME_14825 [Necator americanus]ETN70352.1 hypothetical protein NECAME_14825 [Necator americanus]
MIAVLNYRLRDCPIRIYEGNEEPPIPFPSDIDNSGVIEEDRGDPLPMGDPNKEATDEEIERANEERDKAMAAFSEGLPTSVVNHKLES